MRALIIGWFSYKNRGATIGDVAAAKIVKRWLEEKAIQADICENNWKDCRSEDYQLIIFVCGPVAKHWPTEELFTHFKKQIIVINTTSLDDEVANCSFLLSRDSSNSNNVDISLAEGLLTTPLVGVVLVENQEEYGSRNKQADVVKIISDFIKHSNLDIIYISTELDHNPYPPFVVEKLIGKMDVIITNRLHGLIYAIKYQVPVVLIDGIEGGDKVSKQAKATGWPVLTIESLSENSLRTMFDYCLSLEAKEKIRECYAKSIKKVQDVKCQLDDFISRTS